MRGLEFDLAFHSLIVISSIPSPFSHPPRPPHIPTSSSPTFPSAIAATATAAVGFGSGLTLSLKSAHASDPSRPKNPTPFWASLSMQEAAAETSAEPKTGTAFPTVMDGTCRLLDTGVRRKSVLGLKNINVYVFGVYADDSDVKRLSDTYGGSEIKESKILISDVLDEDIRMIVRLQIVYIRLSISSVQSAFEESVGSRIQKFNGSEDKQLLHRLTVPRMVVEVVREFEEGEAAVGVAPGSGGAEGVPGGLRHLGRQATPSRR